MVDFKVEAWAPMALGVTGNDDWRRLIKNPSLHKELPTSKLSLSSIPPLLRRRFSPIGKCVVAAALPLLNEQDSMPSIFASRYGDIELTLSLLEDIAKDDDLSPTHFSLAVHNAVSGLLSIARQDTSKTIAIAAMQGLIVQTLFEAIGQLQNLEKVLCILYDAPLPEPYNSTQTTDQFPYAIAFILSRSSGDTYSLEKTAHQQACIEESNLMMDSLNLISLFLGDRSSMQVNMNDEVWQIKKVPG